MPTASRADPGQDLLDRAKERWPAAGPRPDFDDFCLGPLAAVLFLCEQRFDSIPSETPGSPVRRIVVPAAGLFPLMVFYAIEIASNPGAQRLIEVTDFSVDDEYWDLISDDPDD